MKIPPVNLLRYIASLIIVLCHFILGAATYASEYEVDEIITAIKNEIIIADTSELGNPKFTIEKVDVSLTVISTKTTTEALSIKIIGHSDDTNDNLSNAKSYHYLNFSFQLPETYELSNQISLGLVEPIRRIKLSLKKAYNTPPKFQMEGFTFKLEFAIEEGQDGGIHFRILELDDLKDNNITTHYLTIHVKIPE